MQKVEHLKCYERPSQVTTQGVIKEWRHQKVTKSGDKKWQREGGGHSIEWRHTFCFSLFDTFSGLQKHFFSNGAFWYHNLLNANPT